MASSHLPNTVLVTGSSSGIGRATADRLAAYGWQVWGGSRRQPAPFDVNDKSSAARRGTGWTPIPLDVTSDDSISSAIQTIVGNAGELGALVHCAGISVAGSIEDVTIGEAEHQFATNYFGAVAMLRAVLPMMRRQGGGRIVVIGSIGGLIGLPFLGHYSASKFALDGMMEALRLEIRPFGIQVTTVYPGDIRSDISTNQLEGSRTGEGSAYHERFRATVDTYDRNVREAREPEVIAAIVARVLARHRQPAKFVAGTVTERAGVSLKSALPTSWFEAMIAKTYGL
jgi:NAD(P)-dependent dehydrogenase (short-subunit alcohol dehydrogenase family)